MAHYEELSEALSERMKEDLKSKRTNPYAFDENNALRRDANPHDAATVWRPAFIRDADKILNCPYYSRCADKMQVFSLYKNDDITRRSLHIQLVARTARTIGRALGLNCELIEAIALGHDIGHTPFGHTGERFLDELYFSHTGLHFAHNLHSVRVLDEIFPLNLTLQTLDGIADHNGELELDEYKPAPLAGFEKFDERMQAFALRRARRGEHENPTAYLRGGRNGRLHAHDGKGKFRAHLFRTDGGCRVAGEHRGIDAPCGKAGKPSADKTCDLFRRTAPVGRIGVVPVIEKPRGGQTAHTRRKHGETAHSAVKYPHPLPFPAGRRSHSVAKFLQNFSLPP